MEEDHNMVISADRIVYAEAKASRPRSVIMREGQIQDILDDVNACGDEEFRAFPGRTIAPCFCDYHMHVPSAANDRAGSMTSSLLRHGIVRAFDGGDRHGAGLDIRRYAGKVRISTAGYALYKKGGYGSYLGRPAETWEEARETIREFCESGADYLKVIQSGIYDPESDRITKGGFEQEELGKIVACARERGLGVFCHANGENAVREAVQAGVSAVIHGLDVAHETLSEMAQRDIAFIPTVNAFRSLRMRAKTEAARMNIERAVERHLSSVQMAFHLGVRLLPGSDSGPEWIPYGDAFIKELRMFLSAGIPYDAILRSAAVSPLSTGMPADFVVLKGLHVEHIMINGRFLLS